MAETTHSLRVGIVMVLGITILALATGIARDLARKGI